MSPFGYISQELAVIDQVSTSVDWEQFLQIQSSIGNLHTAIEAVRRRLIALEFERDVVMDIVRLDMAA